MKPLQSIRVDKINERIFIWLGSDVNHTKTILCRKMGMSKPTLNKRLKMNEWNTLEVERLQELNIL